MREIRSELLRLRRRGVVLGWFGLTALFAVLINTVMFSTASEGSGPPDSGPGVSFPSLGTLQGSEGLVAGLGAASSILGVVTLSFWALATAGDFSSGLLRILASAQPRRWRLLAGKAVALALWTAVASTTALVANVIAAPVSARAAGVATDAWTSGVAGTLVSGWLQLYLAMLVWGAVGLALAVAARSAAVAISVGVGYVLVVESVVSSAFENVGDWLPGSALTALAQGGTDALSFPVALIVGLAYTGLALGVATVLLTVRDITD